MMAGQWINRQLISVKDCFFGDGTKLIGPCNLYDSNLADGVFVGPFVEIGGARIGKNTRISSHSYICPGVQIGAECFIGHGTLFTNDIYADVPEYETLEELRKHWNMRETIIGDRVRIGSGAVILPCRIGDNCIIGAGAVVVSDVPSGATYAGVPARLLSRGVVP